MIAKKDLTDLKTGLGKDITDSADKLRKESKEDIETAVAQIIEAVMKYTASKDDLKRVDDTLLKVEDRLTKVEVEVKYVKRSINDLKADIPTPQEFTDHGKRISKLENAIFPS